jgi:heme/copper-type cytochrome/quinol oxidase subunit 3
MSSNIIEDTIELYFFKKIGYATVVYIIFNIIFTIIYYFNTSDSEDPKDDDWNIPNKEVKRINTLLYVTSSVTSTVGFGDIYPKSDKMRYISMIHQFLVSMGILSIILNFQYFRKNKFMKFF